MGLKLDGSAEAIAVLEKAIMAISRIQKSGLEACSKTSVSGCLAISQSYLFTAPWCKVGTPFITEFRRKSKPCSCVNGYPPCTWDGVGLTGIS